jgi:hypothetical protein
MLGHPLVPAEPNREELATQVAPINLSRDDRRLVIIALYEEPERG